MNDHTSYSFDLRDEHEPLNIGDFVAYLKDIGRDEDTVVITDAAGQSFLIDGFSFDEATDTARLVLRPSTPSGPSAAE